MPVDAATLSSFAADFAKGMTSIRGRRVQRLLKREFKAVDRVLLVRLGGVNGALGLSENVGAFCATDGRGKYASVITWSPGAASALDTRFDLLKDSLPVVGTGPLPLAPLLAEIRLALPATSIAASESHMASRVLQGQP